MQVQGDVAIAELKPGVEPERLPLSLHLPRLVRASPSLLHVRNARERIQHRIEIRTNGQAPMLEVIAGIDDDVERARRETLLQTIGELRPADPSAKRDDVSHADYRNRSSAIGRSRSAARADSRRQAAGTPRASTTGRPSAPSPMSSVAAQAS